MGPFELYFLDYIYICNVLVYIPQEVDSETRVQVQVIYLEERDKGGKETNEECVTKSVTTLSTWSLIILGNSRLFSSGSVVSDSVTAWTATHQAPLSMGIL